MNKKGFVLGVGILLVALVALTTAFVQLTIKYDMENARGISYEIGELQFYLIDLYTKGEKLLLYVDKSADYSFDEALLFFATKGFTAESECGEYQGYTLWKSENKDCFPEEEKINEDFILLFKNKFRTYLENYPVLAFAQNNYEENYDFFLDIDEINKKIELDGKAINPIEVGIFYEFVSPDDVLDEAGPTPILPPSVKGTCSGSLVKTGYTACRGGSCLLKESCIAPLRKAEQIAQSKGTNLYVYSAYRSEDHQRELWKKYKKDCKRVCCPKAGSFAHCPHVTGCAVDLKLVGRNMNDPANRALLESIMCEAGWVRYVNEYWHFEYGTDRWKRAGESCAVG